MCNEESCEKRAAFLHGYEDDFDNVRSDDAKPLLDAIKALQVRLVDMEAQRDSWCNVAEKNLKKALRVRALHEPVDIYEYDDTNGVFVADADGERVLAHRICRECSDEQAVEAVGDCEWWDGIYGNVYWPCPTVAALDGSDES